LRSDGADFGSDGNVFRVGGGPRKTSGFARIDGGFVSGDGREGFLLQPATAKSTADDTTTHKRDDTRRDRSMRFLLVQKYPVFRPADARAGVAEREICRDTI
jgi:hypothetical protein